MKNLVFHRSRDEDYTVGDLLSQYMAENKSENPKTICGKQFPLYRLSGVYYRFGSVNIEKFTKKADRITITLIED